MFGVLRIAKLAFMNQDRFERQIQFILEVDKLKTILRRTYLINEDRAENTAEHSWHLAIMAILLSEHANEPVNVARVVKMVLVHDIVEIDAGDTAISGVKTVQVEIKE